MWQDGVTGSDVVTRLKQCPNMSLIRAVGQRKNVVRASKFWNLQNFFLFLMALSHSVSIPTLSGNTFQFFIKIMIWLKITGVGSIPEIFSMVHIVNYILFWNRLWGSGLNVNYWASLQVDHRSWKLIWVKVSYLNFCYHLVMHVANHYVDSIWCKNELLQEKALNVLISKIFWNYFSLGTDSIPVPFNLVFIHSWPHTSHGLKLQLSNNKILLLTQW